MPYAAGISGKKRPNRFVLFYIRDTSPFLPHQTSTKMYATFRAVLGVLNLLTLVTAIPAAIRRTSCDINQLPPNVSTIQLEIGRQLSKNASIYFPGSPDYLNLTTRWSAITESKFAIVVEVAVAADVAATVLNCRILHRICSN